MAPLDKFDPREVGPYTLLGRLGKGGMGVVYLAQRAGGAGPRVALKVILDDEARRPEYSDRFLREAQAARRVARSYTAEVLDVGTDDGRPYIVTEYIEGPTLLRAVRDNGVLRGADLEWLATAVASALAAIHAAGIVHRDLKPGNILLSRYGARVIDFGIARVLDLTTMATQGVIGTPAYMAPEQALGQSVTVAADIHAWGAVLIYAASGRAPFDGDTVHTIMLRVISEPPDLTGVPDALRPLVERAMAKNPEARPTAAEVVQLLRGIHAEQAPAAPPVPPAPLAPPVSEATTPAPAAIPPTEILTGQQPQDQPAPPGSPMPRATALPRRRRHRWAVIATAAAVAVATAVTTTALTLNGGSDHDDGRGGNSGVGSGGSAVTIDNVSKPVYTIGFQGPLSGVNQQLGIYGEGGFKLAIDEANKKGDLPFTLKGVGADDQGTAGVAPSAAQQLIGNKDVIAVVGPMFSGATMASERLFTVANLASVSPSATNPTLTDASHGFRTFVRVIPNDDVQGVAVADYISKELEAGKVFSVDDASEYGTSLAKVLEAQLGKDGVSFTHDSVYPTSDYAAEAMKAIAESPDVVYYAGFYNEFVLFTRALKEQGYTGKIMSGDGSLAEEYISQAGAVAAEGVEITCPCLLPQADPDAADFVTAYRALNGSDPGTYSAETYDATNAVIEALTTLGGGATRESVAEAVRAVDFDGLTQHIRFTSSGDLAEPAVAVYAVRNGELRLLSKLEP